MTTDNPMATDDRHASDSLIGLIQPFLDDELAPADRARVEAMLARDPVLRDMVAEQSTVRQALRELPGERAPQALQARVLLELDAVDREQAATRTPAAPAGWRRLRTFFRGAALMVPAGATALALFLVARTGLERPVLEDSQLASMNELAAPSLASTSILGAARDGLVLGAAPRATPGVRLVGANVADTSAPERETGAIVVERQIGPRRVLDRHEPAGGPAPSKPHAFLGRNYWLGQVGGQPAVAFESDGIRHTLTGDNRESPPFRTDREYTFLLALGNALQDAERQPAP